MRPEDRPQGAGGFDPRDDQIDHLDALLTQRQTGQMVTSARTAPVGLAPLLDVADMLAPLADARPSDVFAAQLEARLMARLEVGEATQPMATSLPIRLAPPARRRARSPRHGFSRFSWVAVAASVLLAMTVGALTASAHPGAPFYPLRKAVEGLSAALTDSPGATARTSLQRANADLAAFNTAASRSDNTAALAALRQLNQDDRQAANAIAQVSDSGERASLQSQLDDLRARELSGMRAALPNLDWPARIQATNILRSLNATTLAVTAARIIGGAENSSSDGTSMDTSKNSSGSGSNTLVTVTVNGSGFTTGAVLLINGQEAGTVDTVAPGTLTAHLGASALPDDITSVGVGEPDGSAASTTHIESNEHRGDSTTTPEPGDNPASGLTATPDQGGGDGTPNPQDTPSPTATPGGRDH